MRSSREKKIVQIICARIFNVLCHPRMLQHVTAPNTTPNAACGIGGQHTGRAVK